MHDIKTIRDNPEGFDQGLAKRGLPGQARELLALDDTRRGLIARLQALQERRNAASKEIGQAMGKGDRAKAEELKTEVTRIKDGMPQEEEALKAAEAALHNALAAIPNIPGDDVPVGPDETANVEVRRVGRPKGLNAAKQHFEIGEALKLMDFETAAKISGARFVVLKGALARLERALGCFMVDLHTSEHGYTEVAPPLIVRDETMFGTAQLPKFVDDQFHTTDGRWLIPTAEVSLTNLVRESIREEEELPIRVTAWTPCFRAEAGAAGRDTRGMIRQHQFAKVELVSITSPEQSTDEHERMTGCAEEVLKRLDLPFRTLTLSTGDMGFSARKTYDIEVWLPGQNAYREISSCSVCGDFQARRMDARYKPKEGKGPRFVHTLNGSGVAVGRALIAVLENYQNADGSVTIPDVLRPYMNNETTIRA
ncbi:serine--tRNA ligase [Taklimakanibacter lacteus]|uniref:serine--tRNA ligase n=1 Tax=Taklimakanibacter lacteus TaxID=2268456 RepID=UPI000E65FE58